MKEKNYNIHNIVKFRIQGEPGLLSRLITNFKFQYKSFEAPEVDSPDFVITLGSFPPSNQGCFILDDDCYVKDDYLYCKDSYKVAKWKLEMSGFESGQTKVCIDANFFAWEMVPGFIIDPLIILKMNEKGCSVIHGSCVSKNDKAYVFSAQGGAGKTSTALYAIERGYKFLGDNFVAVNRGQALSLLYPLNLFRFNLTPLIRNNIKTFDRVKIEMINVAEKITGLGMATKVNPKDLFPGSLSESGKLASIFLFLPREKFSVTKLKRDEMVEHLVANLKLDISPFIKYMMEYSYQFPESKTADFWHSYRDNLEKNLGDSCFYKVEVPKKYSAKTFQEIELLLV